MKTLDICIKLLAEDYQLLLTANIDLDQDYADEVDYYEDCARQDEELRASILEEEMWYKFEDYMLFERNRKLGLEPKPEPRFEDLF